MNKHLKIILTKMCKDVGADYTKINFKKKNWYWDYEWTTNKEQKFKLWLINYIKNNKEARNYLMSISSTNKKFLEKFANEFIMNYGWKIC
uniref:Uncharacterized protein n=1 Tax=viral metagenome TaxID=1070528 RepID=A0A6M3JHG0_9ZZZZ